MNDDNKRKDEANILLQMTAQNAQFMQQMAQALQQLAAHLSAPTEVIRHPTTGKVIGSRKRVN